MHVRVLGDAGLVSARAEGSRRLYQLEPDALAALRDYLGWHWTQALESFKQHVWTDDSDREDERLTADGARLR